MGDYRDPRYRDDSDDEYRSTTIRRYKIKPSHDDRYENVEVEDDFRSRYSGRTRDEFVEVERRPERPRSAFEPPPPPVDDRRSTAAFYERDINREYSYGDPDRGRITVYESKDSDDDKRSRHRHDDEIKVERRYEDRYEDSLGHDVDRYRKETEYYTRASPPPPPVIIRQRYEPQKIVVQEAPPPAPIIVPRQEPGVVVLRDKEHHHHHREHSRRDRERDRGDEEYYYRHEQREVGPYRGDPDRDHAMAMARFDRHRRRDGSRSDDDDYWVHTRRIVRRERSESPHHKRHLAAGALAGAGITALMTSRPDSHGHLQEHRGRKVIAGTALGALGTEALRRAHSAYGERYRDRSESPDHHSKLKKGLGIAAVALAAAGAAKYYKANKVEKEEMHRGRSRRRSRSRHSHRSGRSVSYSRSPSPVRSKSRRRSLSTVAKAALGTAATVGVVKHFRDKSKVRSGSRGKSRSKSRLRTAAEIGGVAAAAGVATKMWENHKEKKRRQSHERELSDDERAFSRRGSPRGRSISRDRSRSRSRSRSLARSSHPDSADPELGLVEYGRDPLGPDAPARGYESEAEERRRRRRRRRERNASSDEEGSGTERKRSKSRLRNAAAAGLATGAAAFGIKDYKDRKDAEKRERRSRERRDRDLSRDRSIDGSPDRRRAARSRNVSRDADRDRSRSRNRSRRGESASYFDGHGRSSPPTASGGAYYPPYPATPNAGPSSGGYAPYPSSTPGDYPYAPDYMGFAPPPPPNPAQPPANSGPAGGYPAPPPGPPSGPGGNYPPDHVSERPRGDGSADDRVKDDSEGTEVSTRGLRSKSVSFIPLSPESSRTMERHKQDHLAAMRAEEAGEAEEVEGLAPEGDYFSYGAGQDYDHPMARYRRASDPSSDRAPIRRPDPQDDIEDLPDRFDADGRPLDGRSASNRRAWTTRSGEFARRPRREGDWDVRGAWQVGGTDPEAVQRLVNGVTSALEGRQGLLRFIGDIFTGGAGLLGDGRDDAPGENRGRHRRR